MKGIRTALIMPALLLAGLAVHTPAQTAPQRESRAQRLDRDRDRDRREFTRDRDRRDLRTWDRDRRDLRDRDRDRRGFRDRDRDNRDWRDRRSWRDSRDWRDRDRDRNRTSFSLHFGTPYFYGRYGNDPYYYDRYYAPTYRYYSPRYYYVEPRYVDLQDVVVLRNGEVLRGEVLRSDSRRVTILTSRGTRIDVPSWQVRTIRYGSDYDDDWRY